MPAPFTFFVFAVVSRRSLDSVCRQSLVVSGKSFFGPSAHADGTDLVMLRVRPSDSKSDARGFSGIDFSLYRGGRITD
jgi:hypothetical protein